jgi:HlyD family secretion protein
VAGPTVVSMKALPWQASLLSFEIGGILETLNVKLGDAVAEFGFTAFYGGLGATNAGDASRLTYDSQGILSALDGPPQNILAAVRAEARGAVLDRLVNARQNAWFSKYGPAQITNIVSAATTFYGSGPSANPAMLQSLSGLAQTQAAQLAAAYLATGRGYPSGGSPVVVQNTSSVLTSKTITTDASSASPDLVTTTTPNIKTQTTGQSDQDEVSQTGSGGYSESPGSFPGAPVPGSTAWVTGSGSSGSDTETSSTSTTTETGTSTSVETGSESTTGSAYAKQTEQIVNTDYTYRIPSIESQAQYLRAQISLNDQQFSLDMTTQNLPDLGTVLQNELNSIDLGVYELQLGFMRSLLLAPFAGVVTGLYKYPGDAVRPGDPVLRVEDNSQLLVEMQLVYSGAIKIATAATPATTITISTSLYDAAALTPTLVGTVVSARGGGDDDLWDLVVQCANPLDVNGDPVIPLRYTFDYDNTTVTVT